MRRVQGIKSDTVYQRMQIIYAISKQSKPLLTAISGHYLCNLRVGVARMTTNTSKPTKVWVKFKVQDGPIMHGYLDIIKIL